MKTIYQRLDGAFPITVEQYSLVDRFRVTYGLQIRDNLTYAEAAKELGECIFHALTCEGMVDVGG